MHEGQMTLVFRRIAGGSKSRADGIPIAKARFGTLDIATPGSRDEQNRELLSTMDPLGNRMTKWSQAFGQGRSSGCSFGGSLLTTRPVNGSHRVFPQARPD
jgi:hypothetical protein